MNRPNVIFCNRSKSTQRNLFSLALMISIIIVHTVSPPQSLSQYIPDYVRTTIMAEDARLDDHFGIALSISKDWIIVGSTGTTTRNNDNAIYLFQEDPSVLFANRRWKQRAKIQERTGEQWNTIGRSVSIDGKFAVAGAIYAKSRNENQGLVYIYRYEGERWRKFQEVNPINVENELSGFGNSVSISGRHLIVGALSEGPNFSYEGAAYIYLFDGNRWVEQQKLIGDGRKQGNFGIQVAIDDNVAIVGANGFAFIFRHLDGRWIKEQKLPPSDHKNLPIEAEFGHSVAIHNDVAIVGASRDFSGSAYVYRWNGNLWIEDQKLKPSDGNFKYETERILSWDGSYSEYGKEIIVSDRFGESVAIGDDYAIISASDDDDRGRGSGSVYVFWYDGTKWRESTKILTSPGDNRDHDFGKAIALSDTTLIIGAPRFPDSDHARIRLDYQGVPLPPYSRYQGKGYVQIFELERSPLMWTRYEMEELFPKPLNGWTASKMQLEELPTYAQVSGLEGMMDIAGSVSGNLPDDLGKPVRFRIGKEYYHSGDRSRTVGIVLDTEDLNTVAVILVAHGLTVGEQGKKLVPLPKEMESTRKELLKKGIEPIKHDKYYAVSIEREEESSVIVLINNGIALFGCYYSGCKSDLEQLLYLADWSAMNRFTKFEHRKK